MRMLAILGTIVSTAAHSPTRCRIASAPARNRRHVARLLAILDFARIASALVVVVGVTSHLGSGAALSPRRCRIASVGASNRTEMLRLRGVLLTILRLLGLRARLLSILAVYLQKKVHRQCACVPDRPSKILLRWGPCPPPIPRLICFLPFWHGTGANFPGVVS